MKYLQILTLLFCLDSVQGYLSERPLAHDDLNESLASSPKESSSLRGDQAKDDIYERRLRKKKDFISVRDQIHGKDSDATLPTQVFVKFSSAAGKDKALAAADDFVKEFTGSDLLVVSLDEKQFEQLLDDEDIEDVEVDGLVHGLSFEDTTPMDPGDIRELIGEQVPYGIRMVQADQLDVGSHPVTVCIVDTGYAMGHPDLPVTTTGTNLRSRNWRWNEDFNGHGTHIAGTISAISNNAQGVTGAGNIRLHIARALDRYQSGYESTVLEAVDDCVEAGAKIVSMSLGGSTRYKQSLDFYKNHAKRSDVLFIAAAGNQGKNVDLYPASYPSVVSVAAVYPWYRYWAYSNYGRQIELAAPGYNVLSTYVSTSAVHTPSYSYPSEPLKGTSEREVQGRLMDCGPGQSRCNAAASGICLMYYDGSSLFTMIRNCRRGRALGAVIFAADDRDISDWNTMQDFPVMTVSAKVGIELLQTALFQTISLGYTTATEMEFTYKTLSGTSMATPHVAAVAALVWSHHPECNHEQIRFALAKSARDSGLPGCDFDYGFGIVQAQRAHEFLKEHHCHNGNWMDSVSTGGCSTVKPGIEF